MAAKSRVAPRNRTEDPFRALQKKADARQKVQERSSCFAGMAFPAQIQRLSRVAEVGSLLVRAKMPIKNFGQVRICYFAHNCNLQI